MKEKETNLGEPMPCAADYLTDPEFLALCSHWKAHTRIPLSMGDWLRDRGLWAQGERADWAWNEPDRFPFRNTRDNKGGPTPRKGEINDYWYWYPKYALEELIHFEDLPTKTENSPLFYRTDATFPEAIVYFLDNFEVPVALMEQKSRGGINDRI